MTLSIGPNLGQLINGSPGDSHYLELMKQWRAIDGAIYPTVRSASLSAPPSNSINGDMYIIGNDATDAWAERENYVARYYTVGAGAPGWEFYEPVTGWSMRVADMLVGGMLTVVTYIDGQWFIEPSSQITGEKINNWDEAFSWGDHAEEGYSKTDTTYTAGDGINLSGTEFSVPISLEGSGSFVQSVAQTANGITVTLGTPTDTSYAGMGLPELTEGTSTTARVISSSVLNTWLNNKGFATSSALSSGLSGKVDIVPGLGLSQESFTTVEKGKLENIQPGAQVNLPVGTSAGTVAAGNDSRIINGQTAFSWGDHSIVGYAVSGTGGSQVRTNAQLDLRYSQTDTTYSAGDGISLAGTTFSMPVTITGTGTYVQSVVQNASGITVTLGTPPNTSYSAMSLAEMETGTATTSRVVTAQTLNTWLNNKGFATTAALTTGLAGKVDTIAGWGLSQQNFTQAEKDKLASLETSRFKGEYTSLGALEAAHPSPVIGSYANVDAGVGQPVVRYIWDSNDNEWVAQVGESTQLTGSQIKTLYEAQPDTNVFTNAEKTKLTGIQAGAQVNLPVGTTAGTVAAGNDSRIINGQTAFTWGNHASAGYAVNGTGGSQVRTNAQLDLRYSQTDTTYTAGNGLSLSGTTFSMPVTITGTGTYVQSVAQTATGITVTLGTPPNTSYSAMSLSEMNTGTATTSRVVTAQTLTNWINGKDYATVTQLTSGLAGKVNVVAGMGLSQESFTTTEKTKLTGIQAGAQVNLPVGTSAGTVAAGNDSRIINGQTAHGWGNHASAGYLTASNFSTVGNNVRNIANPGATSWFRIQSNGTVDLRTAANMRSDLGVLQSGTGDAQARTNLQNDGRFARLDNLSTVGFGVNDNVGIALGTRAYHASSFISSVPQANNVLLATFTNDATFDNTIFEGSVYLQIGGATSTIFDFRIQVRTNSPATSKNISFRCSEDNFGLAGRVLRVYNNASTNDMYLVLDSSFASTPSVNVFMREIHRNTNAGGANGKIAQLATGTAQTISLSGLSEISNSYSPPTRIQWVQINNTTVVTAVANTMYRLTGSSGIRRVMLPANIEVGDSFAILNITSGGTPSVIMDTGVNCFSGINDAYLAAGGGVINLPNGLIVFTKVNNTNYFALNL